MSAISLSYIAPLQLYDVEKPFGFNIDLGIPDEAQSNLQYDIHNNICLTDVRELVAGSLSCDEQGFKFVSHPQSSTYTFDPSPSGLRKYCQRMLEFVKEEFQAEKCFCYDIRLRKNGASSSDYMSSQDTSRNLLAPPVFHAHIDHTKTSGFDRMRRHLTSEEAEQYLTHKYRSRIVNVWRPLYHTIEDCPIAYCDARTVSEDDLLAADRVHPDFVFELYYLKHHPRQKWYWLSNQTPDEIAVHVQFDSSASKLLGPIRACAHAAFYNPLATKEARLRESVEVRIIVFSAST